MVGYYGYDATVGTGYTQELRNLQAEWRNSYQWDEQNTTTAGFAWNHSTYDYLDGFSTTNGDHNSESTYALFAEHTYAPADHWRNSLAARLELSNIYSASLALRAASSYSVNDDTRVFGSIGTGYRSPGSFQRSNGVFTSGYYTYHGNPDLKQEKSISADLGIEHTIAPGHTVCLTGFWQRLKNGIDPSYVGCDVYYSNDSAHWNIAGVELALQGVLEPTTNTGYKVAWTHTSPKTSDGRQIAWTARNTWTAELFTSPIENLTTGVGLAAATGRTNYKDAATSRIDNYYTLRWYAHYKVSDNLTLHLRVENLTNQKFVTEGGFGLPGDDMLSAGTSVHAGFNLTF